MTERFTTPEQANSPEAIDKENFESVGRYAELLIDTPRRTQAVSTRIVTREHGAIGVATAVFTRKGEDAFKIELYDESPALSRMATFERSTDESSDSPQYQTIWSEGKYHVWNGSSASQNFIDMLAHFYGSLPDNA